MYSEENADTFRGHLRGLGFAPHLSLDQEGLVAAQKLGTAPRLHQRLEEGVRLCRVRHFNRTPNGWQQKSRVSLRLRQRSEFFCLLRLRRLTVKVSNVHYPGFASTNKCEANNIGWLSIQAARLPIPHWV